VHTYNSKTVDPNLKHAAVQTPNESSDIKTQQLEMNEINTANRSSAIDFSTGHNNTYDSEMPSVNNQIDKRLPSDDEILLPDQTVIANEV